jgi:hypothetical protein
MTKKLLFVTTILLVVAFVAFAADVTGKWTYEQPGRNGGQGRPVTITLKADGATLTGEVPGGGGGGGRRGGGGGGGGQGGGGTPPAPAQISNGKVTGDSIYFEVKRAGRDGAETITKYEGTVSGDEMKLKITRPAMGGGDAPPPVEVTAKREKS